jgi:hypothetical protein
MEVIFKAQQLGCILITRPPIPTGLMVEIFTGMDTGIILMDHIAITGAPGTMGIIGKAGDWLKSCQF